MIFHHPEHSLERWMLNSCTCVVMLMVNVASAYLSYLFLMLWARLCMLGRGVSVPRPSQWPPNSSSRLNFFWSMNSWFCLIFNLPEHSLEGSRLNSCTCVVMRVVMVASSHWNYLNFIYLFLLKWGLFLMVWTRLCTLGMGVSVPRPS
jgi:hypothetical protein